MPENSNEKPKKDKRAASKRKADRELAIAKINSEIADFEGSIDNAKDRDKDQGLRARMRDAGHISKQTLNKYRWKTANQNLPL